MASLKQLQTKRRSIDKTRKVTRAMEAVSAVKMRKSQERALATRDYTLAAMRILSHISDSVDFKATPLTEKRDSGKIGIIVITSDKGLAGSLNSAILKQVEKLLIEKKANKENSICVCVGKKGYSFLKKRGFNIIHFEENKRDNVREVDMKRLTDIVIEKHLSKETKRWFIIYSNFESTFEQNAVIRRLFPLSQLALAEVIKGIIPKKGKYSDMDNSNEDARSEFYLVEAKKKENILNTLVPILGNILVYHALLESKASEHSARMVAMKGATDKAGDLSKELQIKFNKLRQAAITAEIGEITSGMESMKK